MLIIMCRNKFQVGGILMFPIKFTVKIDFNVYEDYYIFSLFKSKRYKTAKGTFFLPFILMIPIAILSVILEMPSIFPSILFALPITTFLLFGYLFFIAPKQNYKKLKEMFLYPQDFEVFDDYFTVSQKGEEANGYSKLNFSQIYKVYETHNAFYIAISSQQAFPIPKKDLSSDQNTMLSELFSIKFDAKKYKICYKK